MQELDVFTDVKLSTVYPKMIVRIIFKVVHEYYVIQLL